MDDDIAIGLVHLKQSIDKQNELQEKANGIMRGMVDALQKLAQEIADWREDMPEGRTKREREARAAKKAAVGKYATPAPPRPGAGAKAMAPKPKKTPKRARQ